MDPNVYAQITNLIDKSQKILLLTHAKADCDGLGAALAGYLVLKEMGKEVTIATNDPAPEMLNFLPAIDILQNSLGGSADFIITLDTSKTPIGKIKYNAENQKFNIIITPKSGSFSGEDVSFVQNKTKFDLIIIFDTGNLEHLGPLYDQNVEMFFETPVINIDHHSSNTDFGQVNLVNMTASSATEIFYEYLVYLEKKLNKKLITEDVATLLLAGIITDTGSFQHANTSPHAMETASRLLDLGARQQEIIKNIYKTKKLSTLKLWGIILSKVQVDPLHRMVWSTISQDDLQVSDADPDETEGIIDDLLSNAPGAEVIFLIKYNASYISVSMRSSGSHIDVGAFCAENGGGGHARAAGFKLREDKRPFDLVVSDVVNRVKKFQAKRLNIHDDDLSSTTPEKDIAMPKAAEPAKPEPVAMPSSAQESQSPEKTQSTYLDFKGPQPEKTEDTNTTKSVAVPPLQTKTEAPLPAQPSQASAPPVTIPKTNALQTPPAPVAVPPKPMTTNNNAPIKTASALQEPPKKKRRRKRPKKPITNFAPAMPSNTSNTPPRPTTPPPMPPVAPV